MQHERLRARALACAITAVQIFSHLKRNGSSRDTPKPFVESFPHHGGDSEMSTTHCEEVDVDLGLFVLSTSLSFFVIQATTGNKPRLICENIENNLVISFLLL